MKIYLSILLSFSFLLTACAPYPAIVDHEERVTPLSIYFDPSNGDAFIKTEARIYKLNIITDINGPSQCHPSPCQSEYSKFRIKLETWKNVIKDINIINNNDQLQSVEILGITKYPIFSEIEPTLDKEAKYQIAHKIKVKTRNATDFEYIDPKNITSPLFLVLPKDHFVKVVYQADALIVNYNGKPTIRFISNITEQKKNIGIKLYVPGWDQVN